VVPGSRKRKLAEVLPGSRKRKQAEVVPGSRKRKRGDNNKEDPNKGIKERCLFNSLKARAH